MGWSLKEDGVSYPIYTFRSGNLVCVEMEVISIDKKKTIVNFFLDDEGNITDIRKKKIKEEENVKG